MPEADTIHADQQPNTQESLKSDLQTLGVRAGEVLLVHSSLSAIGWTCGGATTVVAALLDFLGPAGTLVIPAHSAENTDPRHWEDPPVPEAWWPIIRECMPAFDAATTHCQRMGKIADTFRAWPGVSRSAHPMGSYCALGPAAADVLRDHRIESPFGHHSPLQRLYDTGGRVLQLGTVSNSSLHLSEVHSGWCDRQPGKPEGSAMLVDGQRRWVEWIDPASTTEDFRE
ncbi:MAG: AAC(3) family N-acetyltransferase, partial [Planctomycetota bacterium]